MTPPQHKDDHAHCRCMNLDGECPNNHYADCEICRTEQVGAHDSAAVEKDGMEEMVRDFTSVVPRSKSEVRGRIESFATLAVKEALERRTKLIVKELEFFQEHHTLTRSMGNIIEYIASLDKPYEGMIVDTDPEEHNV